MGMTDLLELNVTGWLCVRSETSWEERICWSHNKQNTGL